MRAPVDGDALVVGMTLVPALLSRNRNFALFEDPAVRRARARAALLRGIVRHLAGAQGKVDDLAVTSAGAGWELTYRVPGLRMGRRALLSATEYACVAYLAARAGCTALRVRDEDRAQLEAALRRLAVGLDLAGVDVDHIPGV